MGLVHSFRHFEIRFPSTRKDKWQNDGIRKEKAEQSIKGSALLQHERYLKEGCAALEKSNESRLLARRENNSQTFQWGESMGSFGCMNEHTMYSNKLDRSKKLQVQVPPLSIQSVRNYFCKIAVVNRHTTNKILFHEISLLTSRRAAWLRSARHS
jgi:hypothetical protein